MKVIFLDIDGVMVTMRMLKAWDKTMGIPFDPYCVTQLNLLLKNTGAKIVVSSTWRKGRTVRQLNNLLRYNGVVDFQVIDKTPVLNTLRGLEIKLWLDANKHLGVEKFIILDDDSDMVDLMPRLVKCSMDYGLRISKRRQAVKLLWEK